MVKNLSSVAQKILELTTVEPRSLIWSPMAPQKLVVLTGDHINKVFFLQENAWPFCKAAKKVAITMR